MRFLFDIPVLLHVTRFSSGHVLGFLVLSASIRSPLPFPLDSTARLAANFPLTLAAARSPWNKCFTLPLLIFLFPAADQSHTEWVVLATLRSAGRIRNLCKVVRNTVPC